MKKKMVMLGLVTGLALSCGLGFASTIPHSEVSDSTLQSGIISAGELIHVTNASGSSYLISGDTLTIRIPSNPGSTGYKLYLIDCDGHYLKPVSSRFIAAPEKDKNGHFMVGRPGVREFTFKIKHGLLAPGTQTALKFAYLRPWTSIDPYAHSITIKVSSEAPTVSHESNKATISIAKN
jgi:hypothetical protein